MISLRIDHSYYFILCYVEALLYHKVQIFDCDLYKRYNGSSKNRIISSVKYVVCHDSAEHS